MSLSRAQLQRRLDMIRTKLQSGQELTGAEKRILSYHGTNALCSSCRERVS